MNEIKELVDINLDTTALVDDDLKYLVNKYINNMTDLTKLELSLRIVFIWLCFVNVVDDYNYNNNEYNYLLLFILI